MRWIRVLRLMMAFFFGVPPFLSLRYLVILSASSFNATILADCLVLLFVYAVKRGLRRGRGETR